MRNLPPSPRAAVAMTVALLAAALTGCGNSLEPLDDSGVPTDIGRSYLWDAGPIDCGLRRGPAAPSASGGPLVRHGTPPLRTFGAYLIYWDGPVPGHTAADEAVYFAWLASDTPYLAVTLGQYGYTGPGRYLGSYDLALDPTAAPTWTDDRIQQEISSLIDDGTIPSPAGDTIYFAMMSPGTTAEITSAWGAVTATTCDTMASGSVAYVTGWHSSFTTLFDGTVLYAVIGAPCRPGQALAHNLSTQWYWMMDLVTHELAETITDPTADGWYGSLGVYSEVGDLCSGEDAALPGPGGQSYIVQLQYSNAAHAAGTPECVY